MAGRHTVADDWSQAKQRRGITMHDQHGREWSASIEIKSGHPTGVIIPRFKAPWKPPQTALEMVPQKPYSLHINYDALLRERREAHRDFDREVARQCAARQWPLPEKGEPLSIALQELVGPPPEAVEIVLAASQGNRYVLGLTDKVDPRLAKFFEKKKAEEPDFSDEPDYSDLEEEHDPDAMGGKVVAVRSSRSRKKQEKDPAAA